jgi:hypothetical protein
MAEQQSKNNKTKQNKTGKDNVMATKLTNKVTRETRDMVRDRSKQREVVITLEPGHQGKGMISLRLKGTRHPPLIITPSRLYLMLERRAVGLA